MFPAICALCHKRYPFRFRALGMLHSMTVSLLTGERLFSLGRCHLQAHRVRPVPGRYAGPSESAGADPLSAGPERHRSSDRS